MGRKPKVSEAAKEVLPSPIPESQQVATPIEDLAAPSGEAVAMPRASQFPCPRCGQPMRQNGKSGVDLYYYCRGFGKVIACGFPGKTFTTRERHEHEMNQDLGRSSWTWNEIDGRYEFIRHEI